MIPGPDFLTFTKIHMKYDQQKRHRTALELSVKEILESFNMFKGKYQPHS